MTWVRVGAKCVCINDANWVHRLGRVGTHSFPVRLVVYEIAAKTNVLGTPAIFLKEIGVTHFFALRRFRPLITRTQEQDVALVKSMLLDDPIQRLDFLLEDMGDR